MGSGADASEFADKEPFDVLVVGGGPAGASASTRRVKASAPVSSLNASAGTRHHEHRKLHQRQSD